MSESFKHYPTSAAELYSSILKVSKKKNGHKIPVEAVVKVVEHALLASHPKARYRVGRRSKILAVFRYLPVKIRDFIIAQQLPKSACSK